MFAIGSQKEMARWVEFGAEEWVGEKKQRSQDVGSTSVLYPRSALPMQVLYYREITVPMKEVNIKNT